MKYQDKMEQYKIKQLQGIVIAPSVKGKSYQDEDVLMICGEDEILFTTWSWSDSSMVDVRETVV
jgi:hypothetical protein